MQAHAKIHKFNELVFVSVKLKRAKTEKMKCENTFHVYLLNTNDDETV